MTAPTAPPPAEPVVVPAAVVAGTALAGEVLEAHRVDLETLLGLALNELTAVWQNIVAGNATAIRGALFEQLPDLVGTFGPAAATLGADWYDEMRDLAEVPGSFRAVPISLPPQERLDTLIGVTTQPLFPKDPELAPDQVTAKTLLDGAFERLVADMDRDTVRGSLILDPQAKGWARQTNPGACDFCVLLAGRGACYSARTANFASHDGCGCVAVPVFGGDPRPVKDYVPSPKLSSADQREKNNRRLREYLRAQRAS